MADFIPWGDGLSRHFKKFAFMWGLLLVVIVTAADPSRTVAGLGSWLKNHHGPDAVIVLIFLFSGMVLDGGQARAGMRDGRATLSCLLLVFLLSPLIAAGFTALPLDMEICVGLFLVAVMPPTLSSGVVMTGAAGGNTAHALIMTILANSLAVVSIPLALSFLLSLVGRGDAVAIDKLQMMAAIALRVIIPLFAGLATRRLFPRLAVSLGPFFQTAGQLLVLAVVWMAFSESCETILGNGVALLTICAAAFAYHGLVLAAALLLIVWMGLGRGRRESVLFVGGQKTLPLSIILQVSLFPQYGLALAMCVTHHVVHVLMDAYLVGRLQTGKAAALDAGAVCGRSRGSG